MRIKSTAKQCDGYIKMQIVEIIDNETIKNSKQKFKDYFNKGVIVQGAYDDDVWVVTNEVERRRFNFSIPESAAISDWIGCDEISYKCFVKAYIIMLFGNMTIATLVQISRVLMRLGMSSFDDVCTWNEDTKHIIMFLEMFPENVGYIGSIIEHLEENKSLCSWKRSPRKLTGFRNYLKFDKALDDFWNCADLKEKELYFPVHLWWKLTSVLPLRATEFLLLPRECVKKKGNKYVLTVRRTKLKKGFYEIGYTIAEDYSLHNYEIPEWLALEIDEYRNNCSRHSKHAKDTLFAPVKGSVYEYMTYCQMKERLQLFCKEILKNPDFPIRLGDTRHLAMINLILSGGSPVICRELAGHESIDISSNYYANLSTVVESIAYEAFYFGRDDYSINGTIKYKLADNDELIPVSDGFCDVRELLAGDISECMKNYSSTGKFAECHECTHFYPNKQGISITTQQKYKEKVDADGMFLMQVIEQVRKGNGAQEDIAQALLRLQASGTNYKKIIVKNLEDSCHGKTEKNK